MIAGTISHEFVDAIPETLAPDTLYISIKYATVVHLCLSGCGREVVTPLAPTDWKITYNGDTVSLSPSIGNWSFPCRSHYWIDRNRVRWGPTWTSRQVDRGRAEDRRRKDEYFDTTPDETPGMLRRVKQWIARILGRRHDADDH